MLIAQQKRKENIAEYLLYMWQVEDMIRACNLDIDEVDAKLLQGYKDDEAKHHEAREWWDSLIEMMRLEHKAQRGHLQININTLIRLNDLHLRLLQSPARFAEYGAEFYKTLPFIVELRATVPEGEQAGELETCFNALYGTLMLRLSGKSLSDGTQRAIDQISHFVGLLAAYFKKDEETPLFDD